MDFLDIIITIAILFAGSFLTGKKKTGKKVSKQMPPLRPASAPVGDEQLPEFDSEPDETFADVFGNFSDFDSDEVFNDDPFQAPENVQQQPYFSYENEEAVAEDHSNHLSSPLMTTVSNSASQPLNILGEKFDLRKAFVYQTIMERVNY